MLKYLGKIFSFGENFTCYITLEGVFIEQYNECRELLPHIKTKKQIEDLYYILTGKKIDCK